MQIQYYNMNSNQKCNNKTCQCECKTYRTCKKKKIIFGILAHVLVKIAII